MGKNLYKITDRSINVLTFLLFFWYLFCPFLWLKDPTISFEMKLTYGIINYLILMMVSRVLLFGYKSPSFTDFFLCPIIILWFLYSTYRDYHEPGYFLLLKMLYIFIDISSMFFVIDSFLGFILNLKIFNNIIEDKLKKIGKCISFVLAMVYTLICINLYRLTK